MQDNYKIRSVENGLGVQDPKLDLFLYAYKDLAFGWNFARVMAKNRLPLPSALAGADDFVWRAYLYQINPQLYRDDTLLDACRFMGHNMRKERATLNALLVNPRASIETTAAHLRLPVATVRCYEKLFFNINDRRDDMLFISSIVYPQGRLVEMFEHYLKKESLDMILLRAGYNNGPEDVLYLAGFPTELLQQLTGKEIPNRLESVIMANAFLLARNGWLHQPAAASINHARQLLSAAKQGGQDETSSPFMGAGAYALLAEVQRVKTIEAETRVARSYGGPN